jgi:hypothetical protein
MLEAAVSPSVMIVNKANSWETQAKWNVKIVHPANMLIY